MKIMDIGDIRPREVIDDEIQVFPHPSVQIDTNQASISGTHDEAQVQQVQDQQASTSQANQANDQSQVLQPTHIARDHPLDHIIGDITRGVKTRSRLASFCEHYSFIPSIEPTNIEEALQDVDWVNAMHEELNNFTCN